jgi:spermidine/putrescine transport system ATP-binding protein
MNVERNITYGLRMRSVPRGRQRELVKAMLDVVRLQGYERRMPSMLSGGQRQRVAIARAVVLEPDVLLLDEPLGALDLKLRQQMQRELKELQTRPGITFIYITHDQEEALNMSDRIAIMNNGTFEQIGTPEDIYERPATRFAAQFIGQGNLFEGEILSCENGTASVKLAFGAALATSSCTHKPGSKAAVSVHSERVSISATPVAGFDICAKIAAHRYAGSVLRTELKLSDGSELIANSLCAASDLPEAGETVYVYWDPKHGAIIGEGPS